jgi:CubicO group peptidase (beta-lactamase class C family)
MIKKLLILTVLSSHLQCASAQTGKTPDYSSFIKKYTEKLKSELSPKNVAGLSIAVVDGDSTIWCEGFGYFNKQLPEKVSADTPFLIGSITKTFTAVAVMQLYKKGIIDIDAPLKKYLPEFHLKQINGNEQAVTVRQLMTHHGGIPDFLTNKHPKKQLSMDLILDYVNRDFATFPPNTIYSYSNPGIGLLGILVEKVTHQSFAGYVKTNILSPLRMNSSGIFSFNDMPLSVRLGYNSDLTEEEEYPGIITPSAGIYSSAMDMANYIKLWLNSDKSEAGQVISHTTIDEIIRTQNQDVLLDIGLQIGLVWNILYNRAGRCIEHEGGTQWHRSEICIAPESGLGIVILTNSLKGNSLTSLSRYEMLEELVKIKGCDSSKFSIEPRYKSSHRFSLAENPQFSPEKIAYSETERLSGSYGTFGERIPIQIKDSSLFTQYYGHDIFLLPVKNNEFVVSPVNNYSQANPSNRFYFEKFNNVLNLIEIDRYGRFAHWGERIDPVVIPSAWKDQTGSYEVLPDENIGSSLSNFRLDADNGFLMLKAKLTKDYGVPDPVIPLKIINDSLAVVYGYGRYAGQSAQILTDKSGKGKILRFMNQDMILKEKQ